MRRILERIIHTRFEEYKDSEGWSEDQYAKLRTVERIALMKDHLPEFMVSNSNLYSILSAGIHELEEQECLKFFPVARASINFILEDDVRKREELTQRAEVQKALAGYQASTK